MAKNRQHRLRILVVEDNHDIRVILDDLLRSSGYHVESAPDGEQGLACLQNGTYDILITDLGLPGMSGWDLAREAKRYQAGILILAISSWQGEEAVKKKNEYGINRIIWKPFRFGQIQEGIGILLKQREVKAFSGNE